MSKTNAIIFASLILATIFGILGQGMAYFLNDNFAKIPPIYYLSVLTIISVILYLSSFVLTYLQYKKRRIEKAKMGLFFSVFGGIGLLTSCWSLFVLAMWWG
ncbi:hypothetical protein [Halobacillus sp. A5]|uniref:hypothetical protein n=1 Tax=Halobacillus sp. A5 TaxID=2880263 RepID=UPI0020A623E9|nr:hypothetical protein [Halobacillus sp. A5]MCP3027053.1 hypothetical protein [Halobacillus sp. A5]